MGLGDLRVRQVLDDLAARARQRRRDVDARECRHWQRDNDARADDSARPPVLPRVHGDARVPLLQRDDLDAVGDVARVTPRNGSGQPVVAAGNADASLALEQTRCVTQRAQRTDAFQAVVIQRPLDQRQRPGAGAALA